MNTKTKTILAIGIILVLTAIIVGYYIQQKKEIAKIESGNQTIEQNQQGNGLKDEESISKLQIVSTVSSGTIVSIKDKAVEVKTEKENITLGIQDKTSVYSMEDKEAVIKNVSDLKEGSEITFEYDIKTKNAIAISLSK